MAELAASIAVVLALLALLDIFLSDAQKSTLSRASLRVWNFLDDIKQRKFLRGLNKFFLWYGVFRGTTVLIVGSALGALLWSPDIFNETLSSILWSVAQKFAFLGGTVGSLLYILMARTTLAFWLRAILIPTGPLALMFAIVIMAERFDTVTIITRDIIHNFVGVRFSELLFTVWVASWIGIFLPVVFAHLLTGILYTMEFAVRRIAENPKGPILALSGILAAFAGIIKALT